MNPKGLLILLMLHNFCDKIVTGENILVVLPVAYASHLRSFRPLVKALIKNGHNVTVISKYSMAEDLLEKYHQVEVKTESQSENEPLSDFIQRSKFTHLINHFELSYRDSEKVLTQPELQRIIDSQDHYDLIVAELFFSMDVFFAFGYKFKAPVVALRSTHLGFYHNWILGNPHPSSYIPNPILGYTENMTLFSRLSNSVFNLFSVLYYEWVVLPKIQKQMEKFFNFSKNDVPSIKDIMRNISLVLVNSHYLFGYTKPEPPNVVNIGGIHYPSSMSLSEKIKTFLEGAYYGVIYVSFGSFIQPSELMELGNTMIRELKNFPQRVVMKWDPKLLTEIPENILVEKWISQTEVLNHPKCRLFITHGGIHSTLESLNASVPVLGVPVFGDQYYNMAAAEYLGIGRMIRLDELSSARLSTEINEILNNPKYKENVVKKSKIFRERPINPLDEAVYWVEHIMRHKTATHLRSAGVQLTWYEFYDVDVFVILLVMMLATLLATQRLIVWILKSVHATHRNICIYLGESRIPEKKDYKDD